MNRQTARLDFEQLLAHRLGSPNLPDPATGFAQLLDFYRTVRAEDCDPEQDGDMLLFQWGTWDWGQGLHDEVSLSRQLIGPSGEDDEIWQLTLLYRLAPHSVLAGIAPGTTGATPPRAWTPSGLRSPATQLTSGSGTTRERFPI